MPESNIVLVDRKPIMNYVLACITLITGGASKVGKHPQICQHYRNHLNEIIPFN